MRQVKRWILQIGICFTLLLSLGVYSMSNVHAVNEGITITDNTTGLSEAKYHVTFVLSISMDAAELPDCARGDVIISL